MSALQESRSNVDQKILLQLMTRIEKNPMISQRVLAAELGIALGLMNAYLKRCMKKGLLKATQISPRRLAFFLTPEGFKEKSRLVAGYLYHSLTFFRQARAQCEAIFSLCLHQKWGNIALVGGGELAEIAALVAHGLGIRATQVTLEASLGAYDGVLITDIQNPQGTYEILRKKIDPPRLLLLDLLHLSPLCDKETQA